MVRSSIWRLRNQLYVVCNEHKVTRLPRCVDAPCCIGKEKRLDSHDEHGPDWIYALIHGPAFIEVEPALHAHYALSFQLSHHQSSLVSWNCRNREMGNVAVVDEDRILNFLSQLSQA